MKNNAYKMENIITFEELACVSGGHWGENTALVDYIFRNSPDLKHDRAARIRVYGGSTRTPQRDERFVVKYLRELGIECIPHLTTTNEFYVMGTGVERKSLGVKEVYEILRLYNIRCRL